MCRGSLRLNLGNKVFINCPTCGGKSQPSRSPKTTVASIAESIAAKRSEAERETMAASAPRSIKIVIDGCEPVGKERPRVFRRERPDGRVVTRGVTPEKTRAYEAKVKAVARLAANRVRWAWSKDDRFSVVIRVYRKYESKGFDLDAYIKIIDALTGVIWDDDRYVRGIGAALMPPDPGNPRIEFEVHRKPRERIAC